MNFTSKQYKIIGEVLIGIPALLLIALGIGELSGGIISGLQHFVQLIPLIALAVTCWFYPKIGGVALVVISLVLYIVYFISASNFSLIARLLNGFLLFGLPFFSGISFFAASKRR